MIGVATPWALTYEISPITLIGGSLGNVPGGALPIVALTEPNLYGQGLLSAPFGFDDISDYFAHWVPAIGSRMVDNEYGKYPFANQQVAANALVVQPLRVALLMICPATARVGYYTRPYILNALWATLQAHALAGGMYTVALPARTYSPCLLRAVEDLGPQVSEMDPQPQIQFRWEFEVPLLTQAQAQQALNSLMNKLTSQTQIIGQPQLSGTGTQLGDPSANTQPEVVKSGGPAVVPAPTLPQAFGPFTS